MIDKEEILSRASIEDVFGILENPRKTSKGFMIRCPLPGHTEKTGSFHIHSKDLSWHCYGSCSTGGGAFDFIMKKEGVSFPEALRILGARVGIDVTTGKGIHHRLYEITSIVRDIYVENLQKNPAVMAYLTETRKLTPETIERFKLGCTNGVSVVQILKNKGYTEQEIFDAGVATKNGGVLRDLFFKRVMFPGCQGGKVRGFGSRILEKDGDFKYLNSPTGPIFKKSEFLYGLDGSAIKEAGFAILVEGNIDVAMCHQHGYRNTTAPWGTALTSEQITMLKKYCNRVALIFDGDKAGQNAAKRVAKLCMDQKMKGAVVLLPEGEDPDSYLRGGKSLKPLIAEALPIPVFLAQQFPDTRKMLFNTILQRGVYETLEFLSYEGTAAEGNAFGELQARLMVEAMFQREDVDLVLRLRNFEVRRKDGFIAVFAPMRVHGSKEVFKRFLCFRPEEVDYKKQAADLVENIRSLLKKGHSKQKELAAVVK